MTTDNHPKESIMSGNDDCPRPFTRAIRDAHAQLGTYSAVSAACGGVRSATWFTRLAGSSSPWSVHPPTPGCYAGLARTFRISEHRLVEWIVREWYGVAGLPVGRPAMAVARTVDDLDPEDKSHVVFLLLRGLAARGTLTTRQMQRLGAALTSSGDQGDDRRSA